MMSVEQLARQAYETWALRMGGASPDWQRLDTRHKAAWIAAVQAVRAEMAKH